MSLNWKDVGAYIAKAAPLLGTAIAGPPGAAVGGAISLLCSAFGVDGDADDAPQKLMQAMTTDPQTAIRLAEIEAANRADLARLAAQIEQAYLSDRQGARSADVEKTRATGTRDWAMYILAGVIVAGFFLLTWQMMRAPLPAGSSEAVYLLFGGLNTSFAAVVGYFFGSSKGSADKTDMLKGGKVP